MLIHYKNDSATGEWLREQIEMESEGERTVQLPAICPEAFEVSGMTLDQVRRMLAEEFNELEEA